MRRSAAAGLSLKDHGSTVLLVDHHLDRRARLVDALVAAGFTVESSSARGPSAGARFDAFDYVLIERHERRQMDVPRPSPLGARPRHAAEKWAMLVLRACAADGDLKTLGDWAAFVGTSYSSLCESCRIIGVRPQDARDLARMLSAVLRAVSRRCHPSVLLDVSDRRTLAVLLDKAGLQPHAKLPSLEDFLQRQRFVAADNAGLIALREHLVESLLRR